jgi:hypothetical protein
MLVVMLTETDNREKFRLSKSSFSSHPLQHLIANTFSTLFENFERKECCLIIFPLHFTGKQFWLSPAGMPDGSF